MCLLTNRNHIIINVKIPQMQMISASTPGQLIHKKWPEPEILWVTNRKKRKVLKAAEKDAFPLLLVVILGCLQLWYVFLLELLHTSVRWGLGEWVLIQPLITPDHFHRMLAGLLSYTWCMTGTQPCFRWVPLLLGKLHASFAHLQCTVAMSHLGKKNACFALIFRHE